MPHTDPDRAELPPPSSPPLLRSASAGDAALGRLVDELASGGRVTDLGGWMSRNLRLESVGLVLRVHPAFVSRRRLLAVQHVRQLVAHHGFSTPVAVERAGSTVFRCGDRWAELEPYLPHERLDETWASHQWMFRAMGALHRCLSGLDVAVPRPPTSIFAAPNTLRAWLPVTEAAVEGDAEAMAIARTVRRLVVRLRRRWVSPRRIPVQLVHGDVKLENFGRAPGGEPVYLDFGFVAHRPRVHDLAFSFTHSILVEDGRPADPLTFPWFRVRQLVEEYEAATGQVLSAEERVALAPYTAAVRIYYAAYAGFGGDPGEWLRNNQAAIQLSDWLLDHPEALADPAPRLASASRSGRISS